MSYTNTWDEARPNGASVPASSLDTEIQAVRIDVRERMNSVFGTSNFATADPFVAAKLMLTGAVQGKIVPGTTGGLAIRNGADSADILSLADNGTLNVTNSITTSATAPSVFSNSSRGGTLFIGDVNLKSGGRLLFRNATNTADNPILVTDASDNVGLNAPASKSIFFNINGVSAWQIDSTGNITSLASNTYNIGSNTATNNPANVYADTSVRTPLIGPLSAVDFTIQQGGTQTWKFSAAGHLQPVANGVGDIGVDGTASPNNIYAANNIKARGNVQVLNTAVGVEISVAGSEGQVGTNTAHNLNLIVNGSKKFVADVSNSFHPYTNNVSDLGTNLLAFKDIYLKGKTYLGTNLIPITWPSALPSVTQLISLDSGGNIGLTGVVIPPQIIYMGGF